MRLFLAACLLASMPVLVLADEGGERGGPPGGGGGPPAMPPAPVRVTDVLEKTIQRGRTFVGTIDPARTSTVGSEHAGLVVEFLAREGMRVAADEVLVRMRTAQIDIRIQSAKAELRLRQERLAELDNGTRPEEIEQARARVRELEAGLELRRWRLQASEKLFRSKTISEDELREAQLAVQAAELIVAVAEKSLELAETGPRKEKKAQAQAEVDIQKAEVQRLEDERERTIIRAPFDGYVTQEHTEVGQWLTPGDPVATIVHLDVVDVTVDVVEDFIGSLRLGSDVRVSVEAVQDRVFTGTIARIVPQADLRGRTFPVKIRLENERLGDSMLLKAGMFASATLAVGQDAPALFVPKDAVVLGGPVPVLVWVVDPASSTAVMVPVTLGVAYQDLVEVIAPPGQLTAGAKVVIRGNERILFPGQPLQIAE